MNKIFSYELKENNNKTSQIVNDKCGVPQGSS